MRSDNKIKITGLSWAIDEDWLREMLEDIGNVSALPAGYNSAVRLTPAQITRIDVPLDPVSKHCKGVAFVSFSTAEAMQEAIKQFHDAEVEDMKLSVTRATSSAKAKKNKDENPIVFQRTKEIAQAESAKRREQARERRAAKRAAPY